MSRTVSRSRLLRELADQRTQLDIQWETIRVLRARLHDLEIRDDRGFCRPSQLPQFYHVFNGEAK